VDANLNRDPNNPAEWIYPPLHADSRRYDPFTPLLRAYEGDPVQVRMLTGAHEEGHNITIHGLRWLKEPGVRASGYRNNQMHGISEHFELETGILPDIVGLAKEADYLYAPGIAVDDQWNGMWGILREYAQQPPTSCRCRRTPTAGSRRTDSRTRWTPISRARGTRPFASTT
jgi:hypothetical protein